MRKLILSAIVIILALGLTNCHIDLKSESEGVKESDFIKVASNDSEQDLKATSRNSQTQKAMLVQLVKVVHSPPYEGHIHDVGNDGTGVIAVTDESDHSAQRYYPFINMTQTPLKLSDIMKAGNHSHVEFKMVTLSLPGTKGEISNSEIRVAIITKVIRDEQINSGGTMDLIGN